MTNTLLRAGALSCALLASTALTAPAMAQTAREFRQIDANGVDLTYGDFVAAPVPEGSIGSGEATLPLVRDGVWIAGGINRNGHQWDRILFISVTQAGGGRHVAVITGNRFENFAGTGGTSPTTGSSLTGNGDNYVYRRADGTAITFSGNGGWGTDSNLCTGESGQGNCILVPVSISEPDGKTVAIGWNFWTYCWGMVDSEHLPCTFTPRISGVANSFGYSIHFAYGSDGDIGGTPPPTSWHQRTGATFHNAAVSGNPAQGSVSYSYPAAGVTQVTDMGGRVWRLTGVEAGITAIRRPGATSDTTTITGTPSAVTSVTRDGVTTSYARSDDGGSTATMVVTDALSHVTTVVSDLEIGRPTSITDPLNLTTSFQYDGNSRLTRVTAPEGNYVQYSYDARGNVTETRAVAKSGSGLPDMVATASYDTTCSNPPTCNQPNSVTDARGNATDYTYDATHGRVLTVTAPAPSGSAARPQTRYSYTAVSGEYRLTGVSACAAGTGPTCVGTASEARTVIGYDGSGNVTSAEQRDGTGALSAPQAMTYDALGNLLTVDGPLSGSADTTRYRYNAARQMVGAIGPDPDGAGALKHRAQRITYTDDRPTRAETGTVNSQSDSDWAAFANLEEMQQDYDANARPVVQRLVSGSTTYALVQTSYDALGRVRCTAQRMNPAEFASLPSDACTLDTQGSFGPDRIARTTYDNAGQMTKLETGLGVTGVAADEVTTTYRANGQVETVTDANGNKTTYVYDGHDRLSQTLMPDPSTPGTSSITDFEQLTYETLAGGTRASPLVVSRRLRDATSIGYSYDLLGRLTARNMPAIAWYNYSRAYAYDNFGRLATASGTGDNTFAYDGLGRLTSETGPFGTTSYQYDLAGRRTRLTYTDGFYVTYDHLLTGEVTAIREYGTSSGPGVLATYVYDDRGRRTLLTRGNGTETSYIYDDVSRLSSLTQNLNGSGSDVTLGYAYDPAGEIASNTRSNDAYSFTLANANVPSTADGLNRLVTIGGASVGYDGRGNVVGVPAAGSATGAAQAFAYTSDNALAIAVGATYNELLADSVERLLRYYDGTAYRFFLYDGEAMVAETDASATAIVRRYVHGPGTDEPLVWYEGSDTSTRRWFHADERGSVIAVSDASGNLLTAVNRYDDYGAPQGNLTGRFGYTGQVWLGEVGLYDYRARAYNPALGGRFMQTDPIGYGGGMNLYAYVGNNPLNRTDPLGLQECDDGMFFDADPRHRVFCNDVTVTATRYVYFDISTVGGAGGQGGSGLAGATPDNEQCQGSSGFQNAAATPHGETRGNNPAPGRGGYNTDLPGSWQTAWSVFIGLSRLAHEPFESGYFPEPEDNLILARSPGGRVQLRAGIDFDRRSGLPIGISPRIDLRANSFGRGSLTTRETIHFRGRDTRQCPTS